MTDIIDKETLNELLHEDVLTVTFIKKDGSERVMTCTLQEDILPAKATKDDTATKPKKINPDVMPVYDIKAKGFRSFRLDSIKKIRSSTGETIEPDDV